jgi:hypothetical protein
VGSRGISVSTVSHYGLDDLASSPAEAKDFSSSLCVQTSSEAHPASSPMVIGGSFPPPRGGGEARPGRDADYSPTSSVEIMND